MLSIPSSLFLQGTYHGYDLKDIPKNALPQGPGDRKIEVLLRQRAFFVRGGHQKHISWGKYPSVADAWIAACTRAGVLP